MGRDSAVGIATRYMLNGPGIKFRWEARFSAPVQTGPGSFPGLKRPGRDVDHPHPSGAEVKKGYSCTSAPPLGLRGLLWGEPYSSNSLLTFRGNLSVSSS